MRKSRTQQEARLALTFWSETIRRPCRICGSIADLEAHHVIAKSVLKRELAGKGRQCPPALIWDARNGMSLCRRHHEQFTNRVLEITRAQLSMANEEFAREVGLGWRLDRDYGVAA